MTPSELEAYLHEHIPLSRAMGVRVASVGVAGLELAAPLAPNLNHHRTAFGGSIASLAVLTGWACLHLRLREAVPRASLVIQKSDFAYLKPILGDFTAFSPVPTEREWGRLLGALERKGRGRITLGAEVRYGGETVGRFTGDYVAVREKS